MRHALILCLAVLVLAAPLAAQEKEVRKEAEAVFFKAYYEETGKRDLKSAANAFEEFIWVYDAEEKCRDLVVRAFIALGRIQARSGKDPKEFLDAAEAALLLLDDDEQMAPIRKELTAARALTGEVDAQDAVAAQIGVLVEALGENKTAEEALKLFGARAVPALAKTLRSTDPREVAAAARVTVALRGEMAVMAVAEAISQKDLLFPIQVAEQLAGAGPEFAPAFLPALSHSNVEVRRLAVRGLRSRLGYYVDSTMVNRSGGADHGNKALQELALKALADTDAGVRRLAIRTHLAGPMRVKAVEAGISDPDPKTREVAVKLLATLRKSDLTGEMAAPILGLFNHEDPDIRRQIVGVALEMGGETARKVMIKALADRESRVVGAAAALILRGTPRMESAYREGMVRFCRDSAGTGKSWGTAKSAVDKVFERLSPDDAPAILPILGAWANWNYNSVSFHSNGVYVKRPFDYIVGLIRQLGADKVPDGFFVDAYGLLTDSKARVVWIQYFGDHLKGLPAEQLTAAMESENENLREQVVSLAVATLGAGARQQIEKWLEDQSVGVRKAAAGVLASTYKRDVLQFLKNAACTDARITSTVVSRFASILSREELRAFVAEVYSRQASDGGKYEVLYGAKAYVSDEVVLEALRSEDSSLRGQAAKVAGDRKLLSAWPLLLGSRDRNCLNALAQIEGYYIGMKKYRDVKQMLETGGDAREKAMEMVRSEKPGERRAAVYALGALGDPTAISLLLDLVRDPDEKVREAALGALERLGGAPKKEDPAK